MENILYKDVELHNCSFSQATHFLQSCASFMATFLSYHKIISVFNCPFIYLFGRKLCKKQDNMHYHKINPSTVIQKHLLDLSDCTWSLTNLCERNRCLPRAALLTLDIGGARMVQIQSNASPDFTLFSSSTWLDLIIPSDPDISNWQSEGKRQQ